MRPRQRDELYSMFEVAYFRPHRWTEANLRNYLDTVIPKDWTDGRREAVIGRIATVAAAVVDRPTVGWHVTAIVMRCMDAAWREGNVEK